MWKKAVKKVPGVTSCAVSLLTNSMGVEGTAEPAAVIKAVEDAGYGASVRGQEATPAADASALEDRQTPHLKKRLIASVAFLLILMYFSMGHMMWGWPLPGWFDGNHVAMGLVQLLLAGIVMVINQEFFVSGTKSLLRGSPNMDTLVSLGAAASYGWSVYALFAMTDAQLHGGSEAAMAYMDEFYFESAAMILTLITVGKLLEAHSKGKTTDALKSLMALAPETATVIRDGKEVKIPAAQVRKGDVFVVRPGQSIPVDGIVLDGASAVNEAALTGESVPVDKAPGDGVSAATVNCSGFLRCEATRVGEGHHAQPDHPYGFRRGGDESADCQNGGQGCGRVRPGSHFHRACDNDRLAAAGPGILLCTCAWHFRTGHQLPVRTGPCHAGRHHGRQRRRREKRHSLQNGGKSGAYRPDAHCRP